MYGDLKKTVENIQKWVPLVRVLTVEWSERLCIPLWHAIWKNVSADREAVKTLPGFKQLIYKGSSSLTEVLHSDENNLCWK